MSKLSRDYLLPSILACLAAALCLALAVEWAVLARHRGQTAAPPVKTATASDAGEADGEQGEFELPDEEEYQQMAERPLFMENRKPGVDAVEPPPVIDNKPMTLKLMGIVWTPEGKLALVADAKGKYKRLKPQDSLDGWTLVDLGTDKVTMIQGDKREELILLKKRPKTPTAGPPPVPGHPMPGQPPRPPVQQRPVPPVQAQPDAMMPDEESEEVPEDDMEAETPDEEPSYDENQ